MPRYDYVLLDADNTLFDFDGAAHIALHRVFEDRGFPLTPALEERYRAINHALWAALDRGEVEQPFLMVERFRRFLGELGLDFDPVALNRDYLGLLGPESRLLPGAEDFCRRLSAHCALALATNGVPQVQHARLDRSPITPYLKWAFISGELGVQKPQEGFFDAAFAQMGLPDRSRCVMVGDTLGSDILGGIRAGVDTIWFNPKGQPPQADIVPTYTARCFDDMLGIILTEDERSTSEHA